jgi:hypothetical protein
MVGWSCTVAARFIALSRRRSNTTFFAGQRLKFGTRVAAAKGAVKSMNKFNGWAWETTLEDLLAAAGEVAFEYSNNDKDGYALAQLALIEILKKTAHTTDMNRNSAGLSSPSQLIH